MTNTNHLKLSILFVFFLTCVACKKDTKSTTNNITEQTKENVIVNPDGTKHHTSSGGTNQWALFTSGIWHVAFSVKVGDKDFKNRYEGQYIQFMESNAYIRGHYDKVMEEGRWEYDEGLNTLYFLPNEGQESEWKMQTNGDAMILVGTTRFNNNNEQIKLEKHAEKPSK